MAFGLHQPDDPQDVALAEMRRVLRPSGRLLVLEFSRVWKLPPLFYDLIFRCCRGWRDKVANDADSLPLSRRIHPHASGPGRMKAMMEQAGLSRRSVLLTWCGVVDLPCRGYKDLNQETRHMKQFFLHPIVAVMSFGFTVREAEAQPPRRWQQLRTCSDKLPPAQRPRQP